MSAIAFQAWLDGEQEFTQGVQLYAQHPQARPALVALLERAGAGPFTTTQLVQEIAALAAAAPTSSVAVEVATVAMPAAAPGAPEVPADVAALVAERIALFKEASHLHGTLRHLATDEDRRLACCTIKANFRRIDEIWDALSYHEQHGALPPVVVATVPQTDPAAQLKRRNTLRTYLSAKRGTPEKRAEWTAELADLERKLRQ